MRNRWLTGREHHGKPRSEMTDEEVETPDTYDGILILIIKNRGHKIREE